MIFIEQKRQLDGYVHFQTKRIIKLPRMRYHVSPFPIQYVDSFSHWFRALWQATKQPRFPDESGCQNIQWLASVHPVHPVNYVGCADLQHLATLIAVGNRSISFLLEQALAPKNIPAVTENYPTSIQFQQRIWWIENHWANKITATFVYICLPTFLWKLCNCLHVFAYIRQSTPQKMKLTTHWHTLEVKDHQKK